MSYIDMIICISSMRCLARSEPRRLHGVGSVGIFDTRVCKQSGVLCGIGRDGTVPVAGTVA
jgi:hypothetical protein